MSGSQALCRDRLKGVKRTMRLSADRFRHVPNATLLAPLNVAADSWRSLDLVTMRSECADNGKSNAGNAARGGGVADGRG
jgi:hypothetical protein